MLPPRHGRSVEDTTTIRLRNKGLPHTHSPWGPASLAQQDGTGQHRITAIDELSTKSLEDALTKYQACYKAFERRIKAIHRHNQRNVSRQHSALYINNLAKFMAKVKRNVEHNSRETQKWIVCSVCVCHKERTQNQVLVLCTHCDQMPSHQIDVTSNLKVGNSKAFQRQTVYVLLGTPAKPNAVKRTCSRLGCDGPWVTPTHINCLCLAWIFYTNVINRCADRIPKIAPVPRTPPINY